MKLDGIAALRQLLAGMENDLGLNGLSGVQRDVFYAVTLINQLKGPAYATDIEHHELLRTTSRATLFRCLKELTRLGYLKQGNNGGQGYTAHMP